MRRLVLANEEGGTVVAFEVLGDGRLAPTGQCVAVPGAVYAVRTDKKTKADAGLSSRDAA